MEKIEACYPGRKTVISRYEDVFEEIEKATALDTLKGEFLVGKWKLKAADYVPIR